AVFLIAPRLSGFRRELRVRPPVRRLAARRLPSLERCGLCSPIPLRKGELLRQNRRSRQLGRRGTDCRSYGLQALLTREIDAEISAPAVLNPRTARSCNYECRRAAASAILHGACLNCHRRHLPSRWLTTRQSMVLELARRRSA